MKKNNQMVITEAKAIHGDLYDYSKLEYTGCHNPIIIICKHHGEFTLLPSQHCTKKKTGCPQCSAETKRRNAASKFFNRANKAHNNFFDYSLASYVNSTTPIAIICPLHGVFSQTPKDHYRCGCTECGRHNQGGYSDAFFDYHPEMHQVSAWIYVVELSNENERLCKVGITRRTIQERFHGKLNHVGYNIDVKYCKQLPLIQAYRIEQHIHKKFKPYQSTPANKLPGWTECFQSHKQQEIIELLHSF